MNFASPYNFSRMSLEVRFSTILFSKPPYDRLATDSQMKFNKSIEYSLIFYKMAFKDIRSEHG
jgi:hypothetical protein